VSLVLGGPSIPKPLLQATTLHGTLLRGRADAPDLLGQATDTGRLPDAGHPRLRTRSGRSEGDQVTLVNPDAGWADVAELTRPCPKPAPSTTSVASVPALTTPAVEPSAVDALGTFTIESNPPGAEVYVDGDFVGTTPIAEQALAAGKHEIELRKKGWANWTRQLRVSAGVRAGVSAEMEPDAEVLARQP
jgi:hypothetical protein